MDTNLIIEFASLIVAIVGLVWGTSYFMKNKTKIKGNNNKNFSQQGDQNSIESTTIHKQINNHAPLITSLECSKCHVTNQQLQNGLCHACHTEIELNGYQQEFASLNRRFPHLNFAEAKRYQFLSGTIDNLSGKLSAYRNHGKQRIGILNKDKKIILSRTTRLKG